MSDDVQLRVPNGPNGERLEFNLREKSVGLVTKNLPFILVLAIVGGLGVYRIRTHDATLAATNTHLQALYAKQDQHRDAIQTLLLGEFVQQREQLRTQSELITSQSEQIRASLRENREITGKALHDQNALLARQTDDLTKNQDGLLEALRQQTERLRVWLSALLFKMAHPDQPVSLDLPTPPPERGR